MGMWQGAVIAGLLSAVAAMVYIVAKDVRRLTVQVERLHNLLHDELRKRQGSDI